MSAFFTKADMAALGGSWSWLAGVAGQAMEQGNEGFLEDTLASARVTSPCSTARQRRSRVMRSS